MVIHLTVHDTQLATVDQYRHYLAYSHRSKFPPVDKYRGIFHLLSKPEQILYLHLIGILELQVGIIKM